MSGKFYLIPFEDDINEILRNTSLPDDIKAKRIVEALFSVLYPNGRAADDMSRHASAPEVTHRRTQTDEEPVEELITFITPYFRNKARTLIKLIAPTIEWDPNTHEIKLNQRLLPQTNVIDLIHYLLSSAKTLKPPAEFEQILPDLQELNLPATVVNISRLGDPEAGRQSERPKRETSKWTRW